MAAALAPAAFAAAAGVATTLLLQRAASRALSSAPRKITCAELVVDQKAELGEGPAWQWEALLCERCPGNQPRTCALAPACRPIWDPRRQRLLWVDVLGPTLFECETPFPELPDPRLAPTPRRLAVRYDPSSGANVAHDLSRWTRHVSTVVPFYAAPRMGGEGGAHESSVVLGVTEGFAKYDLDTRQLQVPPAAAPRVASASAACVYQMYQTYVLAYARTRRPVPRGNACPADAPGQPGPRALRDRPRAPRGPSLRRRRCRRRPCRCRCRCRCRRRCRCRLLARALRRSGAHTAPAPSHPLPRASPRAAALAPRPSRRAIPPPPRRPFPPASRSWVRRGWAPRGRA